MIDEQKLNELQELSEMQPDEWVDIYNDKQETVLIRTAEVSKLAFEALPSLIAEVRRLLKERGELKAKMRSLENKVISQSEHIAEIRLKNEMFLAKDKLIMQELERCLGREDE